MRKRLMLCLLAALLAFSAVILAVGCSDDDEDTEGANALIQFVVSPATATTGESVTVAGSGLEEGASIKIQVILEEGKSAVGLHGSLSPSPEVNEFGAFSSTLSLTNFAGFEGTYSLQLLVDDELAATAPLQVTAPAE